MDCNVLNPFLHRVCLVRSKVSAIQIARKIACCLFDGEEDRSAEQRGPRMSLSSYRDGRWPARWECVKSHTAQFEWPKIIFVFEELIFSFNIPNFKEIYRSFNVNECITSVLELIVKPVCHCLSSREFIAKSLQHIKFIYWSVTNVGLKRLSKKKTGVLVVVVLFLANPMHASSNSDWTPFSLICLVVMISVPNWIDCCMLHFVLRNRQWIAMQLGE